MWEGTGGEIFDIDLVATFIFQTSHRHAIDPTRRDCHEATQAFFGQIDSKSMERDPFPDTYTNRCQFPVFHPNTGEPIASARRDAKLGTGADKSFFQGADVKVEVVSEWVEVEDRVAGQLPGAMVSGLSTPTDFNHRVGEVGGGIAERRSVTAATDRVNGRVLQRKQLVACAVLNDILDTLILDFESTGVIDILSEPLVVQLHRHR